MANEGYAKIAAFMSDKQEFAIFRKFNRLNLQNLLLLQAELTILEDDLNKLADRDFADPNREDYAKDWWTLAASEEEGYDREQWQKVLLIRQKLKQYNDHLTHQVFLSNLRPPKSHDLSTLASWFERPKMGNFPLISLEGNLWSGPKHAHDLLAISRRTSSTPLTHYITNTLIPILDRLFLHKIKSPISSDPESGLRSYPSSLIARAVSVLSTVFASMLPISSILILYFVKDTLDKLAIAVAFTGLFAFCLVMTTGAKRAEVFAATSAFAAVQVVFVTGENSGRSQS